MRQRILRLSILAALLTGLAVSCKRDDDTQPETNAKKIIGSWRESYRAADSNGNGRVDSNERRNTGFYRLVTYYTNGSMRDTSYENGVASSIEASYSVVGDQVDIMFPGVPTFRILTLDATTLILEDSSRTPNLITAFKR